MTDLRVWDVGLLGLRVPKLTLWFWVFIQPLQVFACSESDCGFRGSKEVGSKGILQSYRDPVFVRLQGLRFVRTLQGCRQCR